MENATVIIHDQEVPVPDKTETEWRVLLAKLFEETEAVNPERAIVITPYEGNYGLAGYVICINGSPPRGKVIVGTDHNDLDVVVVGVRKVYTLKRYGSVKKKYDRFYHLTFRLLRERNLSTRY